jgi:phage gp29-like protein
MTRIWVSESEFVEVDDRQALTEEIAPRSLSPDAAGFGGWLPDPDEVLKKLGEDMKVYRSLLADAHVWGCYTSRRSGTLSRRWEVTEAAEGGSPGANSKALAVVQEMMRGLTVRQANEAMLNAPFFGISPLEIMWGTEDNSWLPRSLTGKPPEWFGFDDDNTLRFRSKENPTDGVEVPPLKFLLCSHYADYRNPYGERLLSRCFWPVVFKKGGFKFWAVFTEKFGMPWIVGKVPRGTGDSERSKLRSNLVSMVQDAVAVINNDDSIELKESAFKASSAGIYEKLINMGNREVSKAIVGQTASTEGTPGKLGNEQSQENVRKEIVEADGEMVASTWNRLFAWVTELNVAGAAPPVFAWIKKEKVQKEKAERDQILAQSDDRFRFTRKYYMRTYNLEEDDFELEAVSPGSEFAEGDARQDVADAFADRAEVDAAAVIDDLVDAVRNLVEKANTLEQVRDGLLDLYPDMDIEDLGVLMQQALTAADLSGRFEVSAGN